MQAEPCVSPDIIWRRLVRGLLIAAGTLFVALGLLGVILPVLPTTPFLLAAAACYAHASPRLHRWLLDNPLFGRYLRNYRAGKGIPRATKIFALALLWASIGFSVCFVMPAGLWWARGLLIAIALGVTVHIVRIKPRPAPIRNPRRSDR